MSPECVTFQLAAGYCVYLLLSPAEVRSEVMDAVVCFLCYKKGMRDDIHLGQRRSICEEPHVEHSSCETCLTGKLYSSIAVS